VSKTWLNDFRVGSYFTNLIELIEADVELEEELEEFNKSFDRDEIVDMLIILFMFYCSFFFPHFDIYLFFVSLVLMIFFLQNL